MLMTVLLHDVDTRLRAHGITLNTWSVGKPIYDLEYADDTLLMGVTGSQLEEILRHVQVEATLYGVEPNLDKTELLRHPTHPGQLHYADNSPVPLTEETKYLGSQVAWEKAQQPPKPTQPS